MSGLIKRLFLPMLSAPVWGVTDLSLQLDGSKTKIKFQGKGVNLGGMNIVPLSLPVHVQLQASNGECWNTSFTVPTKNDGTKFNAKLKP